MKHIIIEKDTGHIVGLKIYQTKEEAETIIKDNNAVSHDGWVAVPMPSERVLLGVADGAKYSTARYMGELKFSPIDWEDDE